MSTLTRLVQRFRPARPVAPEPPFRVTAAAMLRAIADAGLSPVGSPAPIMSAIQGGPGLWFVRMILPDPWDPDADEDDYFRRRHAVAASLGVADQQVGLRNTSPVVGYHRTLTVEVVDQPMVELMSERRED
jgi:hypothetical protein